jgi:hypothetical protein
MTHAINFGSQTAAPSYNFMPRFFHSSGVSLPISEVCFRSPLFVPNLMLKRYT